MDHLTVPLALAFLFFSGAILGWIIEFLFRNLISHKGPKGRYFINPGFNKGPWLPIYGIGIAVLCVMSEVVYSKLNPNYDDSVVITILIILILGLIMNCIEFIGGLILLKGLNLRLWDYRGKWGNYKGIVCPQFALVWTLVAAGYYLFVHKTALENLLWFSENLAYAFFVGLFFGLFILDLWTSFVDASLIKKFADDNDVIVKYEELKAAMQQNLMESDQKQHFFNQILIRGMDADQTLDKCRDAMEAKDNK